jgi:hypothetical protein|tara:strand:- start:163 stop:1080 length:918 start_codon:yes stop_codon:yes gene_type:complete
MGNTTFSGPVRSENGFSLVSKNGTTGLIQDRTLGGDAARDTRRYFLYEPFLQRPALNAVINTAFSNADATNAANTAIRLAEKVANRNFEVLGTNMTTALCTFNATSAGIVLTTATADQDQAIVTPHLDTNQTAWQVTKWGTENQVEWECSINTNAIDNQKLWAGLKLTNDQLVATDADQAYFKFQTDATNSEAFTDFTVWHFIYSVGGTDYISALPITVAANTIYHLRISIDSDRKASIFVNGVQYNVTSTSGSTGGTAVTTGTTKSLALTDDVDLIPYIGIEAGAAAAEAVDVQYQSISRVIFE